MTHSISVTIPCRNEVNFIGRCLYSIVNSSYDKNHLKVFVCDGMSEDGTIDIIKEYASKYRYIEYIPNPKKTTPFALNLGLQDNKYDVKMILGAHSEVYPDYFVVLSELLDKHTDAGCIGGIIENTYENQTSEIIGKAMSSRFGVGNAHFRTGGVDGYVDTVAFGAYRREVFDKIGFFDSDLARNQDDEFNYRLTSNGFKIYLSSKLKVRYYVRASYKKLFRQYYQYGYWKVYVNRKHRTVTTIRQLIPALFVSYLVFGTVLTLMWPVLLTPFLFVLLAYFSGAFIAALKLTYKISQILSLIKTFIILHLSYGLGYMEGILQFILIGRVPKSSSQNLTR